MEKIVISLGGSLLYDKNGKLDEKYLKKFASLIAEAGKRGMGLAVVTGGGKRAREYAEKARRKYGSEFFADREAIKATRENAGMLIKFLGKDAYPKVMGNFDDAEKALGLGKIGVSGGMLEGLTTDAVSVLFAERIGAEYLVNLGDTSGIFTDDPKKNKNANRITKMTHSQLAELAMKNDQRKAGTHFVFDLVAAKLAARGNLELRFVDGKDLKNARAAMSGNAFEGTSVRD